MTWTNISSKYSLEEVKLILQQNSSVSKETTSFPQFFLKTFQNTKEKLKQNSYWTMKPLYEWLMNWNNITYLDWSLLLPCSWIFSTHLGIARILNNFFYLKIKFFCIKMTFRFCLQFHWIKTINVCVALLRHTNKN